MYKLLFVLALLVTPVSSFADVTDNPPKNVRIDVGLCMDAQAFGDHAHFPTQIDSRMAVDALLGFEVDIWQSIILGFETHLNLYYFYQRESSDNFRPRPVGLK